MSHWRKFQANVLSNVNMSLLQKAVAELGLGINQSIKTVRNPYGSSNVDAALTRDGQALPIGFNFHHKDGKIQLELSGDFYETGLNEGTFVDLLSQTYQKHNAVEKLEEQGWQLDTMERNSKGEIVIEAYQWA